MWRVIDSAGGCASLDGNRDWTRVQEHSIIPISTHIQAYLSRFWHFRPTCQMLATKQWARTVIYNSSQTYALSLWPRYPDRLVPTMALRVHSAKFEFMGGRISCTHSDSTCPTIVMAAAANISKSSTLSLGYIPTYCLDRCAILLRLIQS